MDESVLSQWFRVLGYGNPNAALWFVGIEPGGSQTEAPSSAMLEYNFGGLSYRYDKDAKPVSGERPSPAWSRALRFTNALYGLSVVNPLASEVVWGHCMLSNLAPLPRPSVKHPLGVDQGVYRGRVRDERVSLFTRLVVEGPVRAMIVHGKEAASIYGAGDNLGAGQLKAVDETSGRVRYRRSGDSVVVFCHSLTRSRNSDLSAVGALVRSVGLGNVPTEAPS